MAIDLLTRAFSNPLFVGDSDSIKRFDRVMNVPGADDLRVILIDKNGEESPFPISTAAKAALMLSDVAALVSLTESDAIETAFLVAIDDADTTPRMLSEDELKILAEDLVAGDFTLDFIEGSDDK